MCMKDVTLPCKDQLINTELTISSDQNSKSILSVEGEITSSANNGLHDVLPSIDRT